MHERWHLNRRWKVQNCDLVSLPDLATGSPGVQSELASYVTRLAELGFAGIRVDAAKHIPATDIGQILGSSSFPHDFFIYQVCSSSVIPVLKRRKACKSTIARWLECEMPDMGVMLVFFHAKSGKILVLDWHSDFKQET